jgi:hypothetical protein
VWADLVMAVVVVWAGGWVGGGGLVTGYSRARVGVLDLLKVHALQSNDGDLAALEERNPRHHEEHEGDLEGWVNRPSVLGAPRRVVELLADAVDLDEERKQHECRAPKVRPLAPRDGEGMLRVVGVRGAVVDR